MKFLNFYSGEKIHLGIKTEYGIIDIQNNDQKKNSLDHFPIEQVIRSWGEIRPFIEEILVNHSTAIPEETLHFAPAICHPEKILCVGLNYQNHIKESKMEFPKFPVIFSKFNNALAAHKEKITLPNSAQKYDYEAELVIVIGKEGKNIKREDALSYVFGYTIGNDLSARDLQMRTSQWLIGKSCDGFAPIGPYLVTADEINPDQLDICCEVNGEIRQQSNTKHMIFNCADIISYISQYMTLKPGDIIFTGTPQGVILGYPESEQVWLKSGDRIRISIENLGTLSNTIA